MKTRIILIMFSLQCGFLFGCCKEIPPEPVKPKPKDSTAKLEVVWHALFRPNGKGGYFHDPVFAADQYIVLAGKNQEFAVYNKQTGKRHSAWTSNQIISEISRIKNCEVVGKNKDIILIYSGDALFAYSLHSGQRLWTLPIPNSGQVRMSATEEHAFVSYGPGALSKSWYRLAIVDVYSGEKRDVLELYAEDNYDFDINPPSAYVIGGDTLLFFTTGGWNFSAVKGRVYAYCYNLTKKEMVWTNKQFTIDTDVSSAQPPPFVIENDKLIVTSMRAIHCFNMHTGDLIWQREGLSFPDRPPLYWEGKLYIRYGNPNFLLCLDAQSGQQLWENSKLQQATPAPDGSMAIYKDKLYFTAWGPNASHYLICVDIHTGEKLWSDYGPAGSVMFGVLIDQETGYMYCNTGASMFCVDLNKTKK